MLPARTWQLLEAGLCILTSGCAFVFFCVCVCVRVSQAAEISPPPKCNVVSHLVCTDPNRTCALVRLHQRASGLVICSPRGNQHYGRSLADLVVEDPSHCQWVLKAAQDSTT